MKLWPHTVCHYSPHEVREYCVCDDEWQNFRRRLKQKPTGTKLQMLEGWLQEHTRDPERTRRTQVQVANYINALKRGGQLNIRCEVMR